MTTPPFDQIFNGETAYAHLHELCVSIGPRHAGSPNEERAARYIDNYFKSLGLSCQMIPYNISTFDGADARLTVSGLGDVDCVALPYCKSTDHDGVSGELVIKESVEELAADQSVKGKVIALLGSYMGKDYERAIKAQPAAIIQIGGMFVKPARGRLSPEKRAHGAVPTVNITYEEGLRIRSSLPAECTLSVRTHGERIAESHNVVGELTGTTHPDEIIIVGAHYDTVWASPGGQDNGAGTAILMELARVFSEKRSRRTLRFIAFGGEEMGLRGSIAYARGLKNEKPEVETESDKTGNSALLDRIEFMVNIDVQGTRLGSNSFFGFGPPDIAASVRLLCSEIGPHHSITDGETYSSDNVPFGDLGIPSATFGRAGGNSMFGHTTEDSIEHCSADALDRSGKFIETWITRHIAQPRTFPFERTIPTDAAEKLKDYLRDRGIIDWHSSDYSG